MCCIVDLISGFVSMHRLLEHIGRTLHNDTGRQPNTDKDIVSKPSPALSESRTQTYNLITTMSSYVRWSE